MLSRLAARHLAATAFPFWSGVFPMCFAQAAWNGWLIPAAGLLAATLIVALGLRFWQQRPGSAAPRSRRSGKKLTVSWPDLDRRAHPRAQVSTLEVLVRDPDQAGTERTGLVRD